jgi:preprotein translocase subunit SecF
MTNPNREFERNHPLPPPPDEHFRLLMLIMGRQDNLLEKLDDIERQTDKIPVLEKDVAQIKQQVSTMATELANHMVREEGAIQKWMASLPKKPDGSPDIEGHRDDHQQRMKSAADWDEIKHDLKKTLMTKGVLALLTVLGALVLYWWNNEVLHK